MAIATDAPALTHDQPVIERTQLFIGGEWVDPLRPGGTIEVINSTTEEVMGRVAEGSAADVDRAVAAARAAFDVWSQVPRYDRAEACRGIAMKLAERGPE